MNGWDHIFITTVLFTVGWSVLTYLVPFLIPGFVLPTHFGSFFILVAWVGGIFPDFDIHWKPIMGHRSIMTHSILGPLAIVGLFLLPTILLGWWVSVDRYFITIFLLAVAGHFFLDLYPSSRSVLNRFMKNPLEAFLYIEKSLKAPPGNITKVPKKYERAWLISNGSVLIILTLVLWIVMVYFLP
jgi:hypothetical protein